MNETAARLRIQADQCQWLAADITQQNDPTANALLKMAAEFEAEAMALEAAEATDQPSAT